jgi:hypothetical protein
MSEHNRKKAQIDVLISHHRSNVRKQQSYQLFYTEDEVYKHVDRIFEQRRAQSCSQSDSQGR